MQLALLQLQTSMSNQDTQVTASPQKKICETKKKILMTQELSKESKKMMKIMVLSSKSLRRIKT